MVDSGVGNCLALDNESAFLAIDSLHFMSAGDVNLGRRNESLSWRSGSATLAESKELSDG